MLRKLLLASAVLAAAGTPSFAHASSFDWTGFYMGINAGYAGDRFEYPVTGDFTNGGSASLNIKAHLTSSGFLGGAHAGYNYLHSSGVLLGAEADIDAAAIQGEARTSGALSGILSGDAALKVVSENKYLGSVRGRIGYVTRGDILVYATGGVAYGEVKSRYDIRVSSGSATLFSASGPQVLTDLGWTAGAGVEYPVDDRLTLRVEYLYVDLGEHALINTAFTFSGGTGNIGVNVGTTANIVRASLDYTFD